MDLLQDKLTITMIKLLCSILTNYFYDFVKFYVS